MIPVSNKNISPCSPISSNCVIWQGPDIPCINICNGDTVSDVVGKLGDELCSIIDATCQCNPDLSGLDVKCITVEVPGDLESTLQGIIDYVCSLTPGGGGSLPNITLPACLRYNDPLGNPVTQLPLDQFAVLLGNKVCDIITDVNNLELALADLQTRVTVLENCVLPCTPSTGGGDFDVLSGCLFPGQLVPISQLVQNLESAFCQFRAAVGTVSLINSAVSAQCLFGTTPTLSGSGTYGSLSGWVSTPTTLAESNFNQWLVLCDLYAAVQSIQNNCCVTGCNGVVFDVRYQTVDNNGDGIAEALTLNFSNSTIPAGFSDCNGNTTITITDSIGTSITTSVNVTSSAASGAGVTVTLGGLNTTAPITLDIPFCVTDGTSQCSDKQTVIVPLQIPCPTVTATSVLSDINVSFPNSLGTGVVYSIVAIDTTTGATLGQTVITNPGTVVTHTFGGAIGGRVYNIVVSVTQNGSTKSCPPVSVTAQGAPSTYVITFCKDNTTLNVAWNGTPAPVIGNVYKLTDGVNYTDACFTVTAGPLLLTPTYTVDTADITTEADCNTCMNPVPCISYTVGTYTNAQGEYTDCSGVQQTFSIGGASGYDATSFCALQNTVVVVGDYTVVNNGPCGTTVISYNCVSGTCMDPETELVNTVL